MNADVNELDRTWRATITAPEYAVMLRELCDLGCRFEWRAHGDSAQFVAVHEGDVIAAQDLRAHEEWPTVVYDVLNRAADKVEILS